METVGEKPPEKRVYTWAELVELAKAGDQWAETEVRTRIIRMNL